MASVIGHALGAAALFEAGAFLAPKEKRTSGVIAAAGMAGLLKLPFYAATWRGIAIESLMFVPTIVVGRRFAGGKLRGFKALAGWTFAAGCALAAVLVAIALYD